MARGIVDYEGLNSDALKTLKSSEPPADMPFDIRKIGHVVLMVEDLERSVAFYTQVLGFRVSDAYPDTMMSGRMVFMRCNADHHGVALVGGGAGPSDHRELHHMAFEVATLDEVLRARDHLNKHKVPIDYEGRRRAGAQVAVEFSDPDGHRLEIFWGLDQVGSEGKVRSPEEWREEFSLEAAIDNPPAGQDTALADPSLRKS